MSYIDIALLSVYHDRLPIEANGQELYEDGLLNVNVIVVGTDMSKDALRQILIDKRVLRVDVSSQEGDE